MDADCLLVGVLLHVGHWSESLAVLAEQMTAVHVREVRKGAEFGDLLEE